jgi:hypothetical protein
VVLTVVAVLGCVLVPAGAALVASGLSGERDGRTVAGILLGLAGLVCFRVLSWARRIRLMTRAGLALHVDDNPPDERRTPPH